MDGVHVIPVLPRKSFLLRVVTSSDQDRAGEDLRIVDQATIGRDRSCTLALDDKALSSRHARLESTPEGLRVIDLGSSNGTWIGDRRVTEVVLKPGEQCRMGNTVFECCDDDPLFTTDVVEEPTMVLSAAAFVPQPPAAAAPVGFVLQVVEGTGPDLAGREYALEREVVVGRAQECDIVVPEADVSRRHVRIEATAAGFLLTDLGSTAGVWIGNRRITQEMVPAGLPFRIGGRVVLQCRFQVEAVAQEVDEDATRFVPLPQLEQYRDGGSPAGVRAAAGAADPAAPALLVPFPPPEGVTEEDFEHTVMLQAVLPAAARRSIDDLGDLVPISAHEPFLVNDPGIFRYVVSGGILLFAVAVEKGEPVGSRSHFLAIGPGQGFFGFDPQGYGLGGGFLAVAKQGTTVRAVRIEQLQELARDPEQVGTLAALVDLWIGGLAKALLQSFPVKRANEIALVAGERKEVDTKTRVTSAEGVVWVDLWSGSVLFDDMARPVFSSRRAMFPVTPDSWIQSVTDEFGALSLAPTTTVERLADGTFWSGLDVYHQTVCECEFVSKKLATVDEYVRLQQKAEHREAAREAAYDAIGSVMRSEAAAPQEFLATAPMEPVLRACTLVGERLGMKIKAHPSQDESLTYEERVGAVASASSFRTRVVALRDAWWTEDHGPLLGQLAATKQPVALLPTSPTSYEWVDPMSGERTKVTPERVEQLALFAFSFYRPFPDTPLRVSDLIRFGAHGLKRDLYWVMGMAIVIGIFGTVTPYLTGRVLDEAVPQAERNLLFVFGLALGFSGIASALFKLVQGVATVRIQARMGASIQSAVWDRIMNLPVNFFRRYSAGDLADRAQGVEAIQDLISGAGVAAILGSISGLFYVGQMFTFDVRLALLAVLLTLSFVGVNMTMNYLQLRHQRLEMQLRGGTAGLVLNLLTGVSKLRICGSELHAFRVWAERFANQRRISFKVGNIQSIAAVFGSIFPILSNLAIFYVMLGIQEQATLQGRPAMTTGDFVAFTTAYGLFMAAMQSLGDASLSLLRIVPIYERLKPILDCQPEVDPTKAFPGKLKGEIELSHVHFRYDPDGPWIIRDLSLKIKAGEFMAFVGGSGCGKSTLMRLMLGFETPSSGTIRFDGQDLSQLDLRLVRQQMGVVLQVSRLMPTEIYRNIIGVSSRTIQDAWWAAERAGLADDIKQMPMGMHTYVSEGGGTLSGGQRQRLMIARAIVNRPKILFLDEATSALDNRSQAIVTESMDKMDATRIVIAHRLSTIINADRICYMEGGRIVEMGSYDELMQVNGLFAQLARRQVV